MHTRTIRLLRRAALLASLVILGCDPTTAGGGGDAARGSLETSKRISVAETALKDARVLVRQDGAVEIYDRNGQLRAQILDPNARFQATLPPITGTQEWARPHPQVSVPLGGLSDWLTRSARDQRTRARLEAEGLTDSQRLMVAIAEAAENSELRLAELDGELDRLWSDTTRPAAERRRLLFERWDECAEGDGVKSVAARIEKAADAPDTLRAQDGERARQTIERFVRARLPAGSPDAYRGDELAELNRRRTSRRPFAPYDVAG